MRFIHCSDIHLGKTINNNFERYRDYFDIFSKVIAAVINEKVDFLLIAGDLFHQGSISPNTLADSMEVLQPLKDAGIPVVAIEGNHDFYQRRQDESWLEFLARRGYMKLLRPTRDPEKGTIIFEPFEESTGVGGWINLGGLSIYGLGYYATSTAKMLQMVMESLPEKGDIGIFHTGVWDSNYITITIGRLTSKEILPLKDRFRYTALGHGHRPYLVEDENNIPFAYNPGALEIVNPEELKALDSAFAKINLVDMSESTVNVQQLKIPRRPFLNLKINVEGAVNSGVITEILQSQLTEEKKRIDDIRPILRVDFTGNIKFAPNSIDIPPLEEIAKDILNPIHITISNSTTMFRYSSPNLIGKRNLEEIFKNTILKLLEDQDSYKDKKEDILELILDLKKNIIDEKTLGQDEIIDMIHRKRMQIYE